MLVQTTFDLREVGSDSYVGEAYCSLCGKSIGVINQDELKFLVYTSPSDLLCFECEDLKPPSAKIPASGLGENLLRAFVVNDVKELPLHCAPMWSNRDGDAVLYLCPNVGWLLWLRQDDGEVRLNNVKLSSHDANAAKRLWDMSPSFAVKPLVL